MRRRGSEWLLVLAGLAAGCIGTNPEWDGPTTEGWTPMMGSRCSEAEGEEQPTAGTGDDATGASTGTGVAEGDACAVIEPEACGLGLVACAAEGEWFCADLRTHEEHCGACFHDCAAYGDATCEAGECRCDGGPWWRVCGLGCTDTRSDPMGCGAHCQDCRLIYGEDARCLEGVCGPGWGK